jgi:hypothetical protein
MKANLAALYQITSESMASLKKSIRISLARVISRSRLTFAQFAAFCACLSDWPWVLCPPFDSTFRILLFGGNIIRLSSTYVSILAHSVLFVVLSARSALVSFISRVVADAQVLNSWKRGVADFNGRKTAEWGTCSYSISEPARENN